VSPINKIGSFRYYALYRGRDGQGNEVGGKIFTSWEGIRPYVQGVPGNIHKGFDLQYQAVNFSMTGDANISQELLMEYLAKPEQKESKTPRQKVPDSSLFNPKIYKLKTVIEEEEVLSVSERKLLEELEAQRIMHLELVR
jgi:viroplasmin and RNaseH domain-containing protein